MLREEHGNRVVRELFERAQHLASKFGGQLTARQLQKSSRKWRSAEEAAAALESLVGCGLGRWEDVPTTAKGGHPSRAFVPLPTADTTDTTTDDDDEGEGPGGVSVSDTTPPPPTQPPGDGNCESRRNPPPYTKKRSRAAE